jgi:hypothetical protein
MRARSAYRQCPNRKNWLKTLPGKGYFVIFRLYGPTKAFFDKTWKPSDVEKQG